MPARGSFSYKRAKRLRSMKDYIGNSSIELDVSDIVDAFKISPRQAKLDIDLLLGRNIIPKHKIVRGSTIEDIFGSGK